MNKKGMTLVELLAVLALMAILAVLVIPSIIQMRNDTLKEDYNNRVEMIKNAAIEWGNDNLVLVPKVINNECSNECDGIDKNSTDGCATPTIGYLIDNGYLKGASNNSEDKGRVMINPITGDEMNGLLVCVRYDTNDILTRKLVAYIVGSE